MGSQLMEIVDRFILNDDAFWCPLPGAQLLGYISQADELFYGGRAGGGKTDLILGLAATAHTRSIIFRRTYPLLESIWSRGKVLFRGLAAWNGMHKTFWFQSHQRMIQLGAMQYEEDRENYQGRPYDLFAFDELPQFTYSQYSFVIGWNRTTVPGQRCRIVSAGNPPTNSEGAWVIDYWAPWLDPKHSNPAEPGELRWFVIEKSESIEVPNSDLVVIGGQEIKPSSRTFIPAKLEDNPYLSNTTYRQRLQGLPEPLRSQLLYGDFSLLLKDDQWQVIPTDWILRAVDIWKNTSIPQVADENGKAKKSEMTCIGVDVARGGDDRTILAPRYLNYIDAIITLPGRDTPNGQAVAGEIVKIVNNKQTRINIDVIGVGSSAYDYIADYGYNVYAINSSEASRNTDSTGLLKYANLRAELWWNAREMLDPENGNDVALPDDKELIRELTSVRWKITAQGILIESKKDLIKRIGKSPDKADGVVYALFTRSRIGII